MLSIIPHIVQLTDWDCGLACVSMVLLGLGCARCSLADIHAMYFPLQSIWTIDLAFILRHFAVRDFTMYTSYIGINWQNAGKHFYRDCIADDIRRIHSLFARSKDCHVRVIPLILPMDDIRRFLVSNRYAIIMLVNANLLHCKQCKERHRQQQQQNWCWWQCWGWLARRPSPSSLEEGSKQEIRKGALLTTRTTNGYEDTTNMQPPSTTSPEKGDWLLGRVWRESPTAMLTKRQPSQPFKKNTATTNKPLQSMSLQGTATRSGIASAAEPLNADTNTSAQDETINAAATAAAFPVFQTPSTSPARSHQTPALSNKRPKYYSNPFSQSTSSVRPNTPASDPFLGESKGRESDNHHASRSSSSGGGGGKLSHDHHHVRSSSAASSISSSPSSNSALFFSPTDFLPKPSMPSSAFTAVAATSSFLSALSPFSTLSSTNLRNPSPPVQPSSSAFTPTNPQPSATTNMVTPRSNSNLLPFAPSSSLTPNAKGDSAAASSRVATMRRVSNASSMTSSYSAPNSPVKSAYNSNAAGMNQGTSNYTSLPSNGNRHGFQSLSRRPSTSPSTHYRYPSASSAQYVSQYQHPASLSPSLHATSFMSTTGGGGGLSCATPIPVRVASSNTSHGPSSSHSSYPIYPQQASHSSNTSCFAGFTDLFKPQGKRGYKMMVDQDFVGHYIVLIGYDLETDTIYYRDPGSPDALCSCSASVLEAARVSSGTDHDMIVIKLM